MNNEIHHKQAAHSPRPLWYRSLEDWEADVKDNTIGRRRIPVYLRDSGFPQPNPEYPNISVQVGLIVSENGYQVVSCELKQDTE